MTHPFPSTGYQEYPSFYLPRDVPPPPGRQQRVVCDEEGLRALRRVVSDSTSASDCQQGGPQELRRRENLPGRRISCRGRGFSLFTGKEEGRRHGGEM